MRLAATVLALLALAGCYREATDASAARVLPRYTGNEPWTIDGVRPGQDFEAVKQLLGEPLEVRQHPGGSYGKWGPWEIFVSFDPAGRVTEVMGTSVQAGGKVLVAGGASEAEVTQVLGPGRVQKSSRPKGSGVISLGREHVGTTLIYDRDGLRFELPVFGPATGRFLVRPIPAKR